MNITYRIGNLELRLRDIPEKEEILHSPYSEIVQWNSDNKYCWTIATFEYDKNGYPELRYCGDRPLALDGDDTEVFIKLIKEGYSFKRDEKGRIEKYNKNF